MSEDAKSSNKSCWSGVLGMSCSEYKAFRRFCQEHGR